MLSITDHLHFTQTLTTLSLVGNNIGNEGARYLANSLRVNTLKTLHLEDNHISHEGAQYLASALEANAVTLESIDLIAHSLPYFL